MVINKIKTYKGCYGLLMLLVILFLSFACKQKKTEKSLVKNKIDTPVLNNINSFNQESILQKRDSIYKVISNTIIDTCEYKNLPIWDSSIDRYGEAYIDTFSENGNKFRLISPIKTFFTGGNSIFLEQKKVGHWVNTQMDLSDNNRGGGLHRDRDINNDGFKDITNNENFSQDVYFYNPKTRSFKNTPYKDINADWELIDTSKNIFCDFQQLKGMSGQIHSTLYTYRKFEKIIFFDLELYNSDGDNADLITKLILRKCKSGTTDIENSGEKEIEVVKLKKPINIEGYDDHGIYPNGTDRYFDYVGYWKEKYKKLLGYQ